MSDFYKTLHKQLRHLIDDLTIATDDDGHTLYVPKDTLMFSNFIAALIELMPALAAKAQPAQAGQVLTDDEVALIVAECAASAHRQDDFSFARAIEQAVMAKRVPQWLPISTAPKGQRVMVWIADKEAGENIAFAKVWFHADGTLGGGAEGFNGPWDLTHWQPLPPPPGIGGEKGGE